MIQVAIIKIVKIVDFLITNLNTAMLIKYLKKILAIPDIQ